MPSCSSARIRSLRANWESIAGPVEAPARSVTQLTAAVPIANRMATYHNEASQRPRLKRNNGRSAEDAWDDDQPAAGFASARPTTGGV
ncbi:hypothetical protein BRAS3843_100049 [Bradyrhizobium sp. STM 3843]|nr:hypothetical protein BRAS3843_100049 [Bradyrhizobium sp. STM 3843]